MRARETRQTHENGKDRGKNRDDKIIDGKIMEESVAVRGGK
jgi:hypothetical protein